VLQLRIMDKETVYDQYNASVIDLGLQNPMSLAYFETSFWPRVENGMSVMRTNGVEITKKRRVPCLILDDNGDMLAAESESYMHLVKNNFPKEYVDLRQAFVAVLVGDIIERDKAGDPINREGFLIKSGDSPIRISFGESSEEMQKFVYQMAQNEGIQIREQK